MLISIRLAARLAYGVDRAIQANAQAPVAVVSWEAATAAVKTTWKGYVSAFMSGGAVPALAADATRIAAFNAVMASAKYTVPAGKIHNKTVSFTLSPSTTTKAAMATQQLTVSAALDAYGDAISGEKYTYVSSDITKATVDAAGLITAVATGSATITATSSSGIAHTCVVTIS